MGNRDNPEMLCFLLFFFQRKHMLLPFIRSKDFRENTNQQAPYAKLIKVLLNEEMGQRQKEDSYFRYMYTGCDFSFLPTPHYMYLLHAS